MQRRLVVTTVFALSALLVSTGQAAAGPSGPTAPASGPLGTVFTYQGRLNSGSTPFNGSCQMAFRLYDDSLTGTLIAGPVNSTVAVTDGYFTVPLDFGSGVFIGQELWLDIQVKWSSRAPRLTA